MNRTNEWGLVGAEGEKTYKAVAVAAASIAIAAAVGRLGEEGGKGYIDIGGRKT